MDNLREKLAENKSRQQEILKKAIVKANAFYEGYVACIEDILPIAQCSDYQEGADHAFYEICKELDISSQDIREMNTSIDEKAALLVERIRSSYCPPSGT